MCQSSLVAATGIWISGYPDTRGTWYPDTAPGYSTRVPGYPVRGYPGTGYCTRGVLYAYPGGIRLSGYPYPYCTRVLVLGYLSTRVSGYLSTRIPGYPY